MVYFENAGFPRLPKISQWEGSAPSPSPQCWRDRSSELALTAAGTQNGTADRSLQNSASSTHSPALTLLDLYPKGLKTDVHTKTSTRGL